MREATAADFDLVYDIYMDESVNPFMRYEPMDKDLFLEAFDDLMSRDYFWIFQNDKGQDCGMGSAVLYDGRLGHVAEIRSLGIKKEAQGKGLGRRVMGEIVSALMDKNIERIQLFAESDNENGLKFYDSLGFEREGVMKNYFQRGDGHYVDEIVFGLTDFDRFRN
tara:strand:- start:472 stop:966 length:495 start_codon:yes stop_codon:yes gene_type:complete